MKKNKQIILKGLYAKFYATLCWIPLYCHGYNTKMWDKLAVFNVNIIIIKLAKFNINILIIELAVFNINILIIKLAVFNISILIIKNTELKFLLKTCTVFLGDTCAHELLAIIFRRT